jgi:prolyl-tRNA synthetase
VIQGEKTAGERFPGAVQTYCIEAMMQDRKALQAGTSHFLGQNFAKASGIEFTDETNARVHAWTTSWGVSTRLIGGMIMTHGDDDGMACPPRLAPTHAVILPIYRKPEDRARVLEYCTKLREELRGIMFAGAPLRIDVDDRDTGGGEKKWQWIKKGVPLWLEVGPRDIDGDSVFMGRRDQARDKSKGVKRGELVSTIATLLQSIQDAMYERAVAYREEHTRSIETKDDFYAFFAEPKKKDPNDPTPIHAGFALAHFNGDPALEAKIKEDLKVTVRCIPLDNAKLVHKRIAALEKGLISAKHDVFAPGTCPFTGQPSAQRVVWAKSY